MLTVQIPSPHAALDGALQALMAAVTPQARRNAIQALEETMAQFPQVEQPLTHHFQPGLYAREIFNPKGCLIVTKEHKEPNFSFIMRGKLQVMTEEGTRTLAAPAFFKTHPGTKRVLYSLEDTVFVTVHPNPDDCEDLTVLESRIIGGAA